ncbi:MAG: Signal peptidase [Acidimicrobiaceae bacterium]|nr:Signal peptidase [Acidimicrobiaceae bacterium]
MPSSEGPSVERRGAQPVNPGAQAVRTSRSSDNERRSGIEMTPDQVAARRAPPFLSGPRTTLALLLAFLLLGALCLGVGFTRPIHRVAPLTGAYEQAGHFSYKGAVNSPTPVYPSGFVTSGEAIYPSLISTLVVTFHYEFKSGLPHQVHGTIQMRALLLSQSDTWHQLTSLANTTSFSGDQATVTASLRLKGLYTLINRVSEQSGLTAQSYLADLQPVVHLVGHVGGHPIAQTFLPVIPFEITPTAITLNMVTAPAPPGATYVLPSASVALAATLAPTASGSIPHQVDDFVAVARYQIDVSSIRVLGIVLATLALLFALFHDQLRRRQTLRSDEELIASRLHSLIVPVRSLSTPAGTEWIEIPNFSHLAGMAQFLERPILYCVNDGKRSYAVDDDPRRYIYRPAQLLPTLGGADEPLGERESAFVAQRGTEKRARNRSRRVIATRSAAGLVVLTVALTLVTSFTASTNVPTSRAGTVLETRTLAELTPTGCSSLALTSIVEHGGTFTNSASHVLVIGTSAADTITDSGTGNCIVGGAGVDTVHATSSDICIVGPTSGATYRTCTKS